MPDPQWDPSGLAHDALQAVVEEHGTAPLSDPSALADLLGRRGDAPQRSVALILGAAGANVPASLEALASEGMAPEAAVEEVARRLAEASAYDPSGCRWVVAEFAQVLPTPNPEVTDASAVAPPPGEVVPQEPSSAMAPPPAAGEWDASTQGGFPQRHARRGSRRLVVLIGVTVLILGGLFGGLAAGQVGPFAPSGPSGLYRLLPGDVSPSSCGLIKQAPSFTRGWTGMTSWLDCGVNPIDGAVFAFQFANHSDYANAFATFNEGYGFLTQLEDHQCPPVGGATEGRTTWYSTPLFPSNPGQILECTTDLNFSRSNSLRAYVWTMPVQNAFLFAISPEPISVIDHWWSVYSPNYN